MPDISKSCTLRSVQQSNLQVVKLVISCINNNRFKLCVINTTRLKQSTFIVRRAEVGRPAEVGRTTLTYNQQLLNSRHTLSPASTQHPYTVGRQTEFLTRARLLLAEQHFRNFCNNRTFREPFVVKRPKHGWGMAGVWLGCLGMGTTRSRQGVAVRVSFRVYIIGVWGLDSLLKPSPNFYLIIFSNNVKVDEDEENISTITELDSLPP